MKIDFLIFRLVSFPQDNVEARDDTVKQKSHKLLLGMVNAETENFQKLVSFHLIVTF